MRRNKWARLSPEEIKHRVLSLETIFGQKNLASVLGVSKDSERRYREGKTFPQTKEIYNKINRLYNSKKKLIKYEEVQKRQEAIQKRSSALKKGKLKTHYIPIYPDYMYNSPASMFDGVGNWDKLEELSEQGYLAAYEGYNQVPMEVQFTVGREPLSRFGMIVKIIGIIQFNGYPKEENGYTGVDTKLVVSPIYYRLIPGLKKSDDFNTRMEKIREYFIENMKIERGFPLALLGFYFDETDYI